MVDTEAWRAHLAAPVRERKIILGPGSLAGFTTQVQRLLEDGAQPPLVVASGLGTGALPADGEARHVLVDLPQASSLSTGIRAEQAVLDDLPSHVVTAVEAYDPHREALWLGHAFVHRAEVVGRPVLGGRPPRWAALEDKTVCDALFDAAGVRRAPASSCRSRRGPCGRRRHGWTAARVAPWAVVALALADRLWGTGFGPTAAAPDVRTGGPVR